MHIDILHDSKNTRQFWLKFVTAYIVTYTENQYVCDKPPLSHAIIT